MARGDELYTNLVGKPEGKGPLDRRRRRLEESTRTDLQEMGCGLDSAGKG
jgi:hypothetical protein